MNTTDYDRQAAEEYFFDLLSNGSRMDEHGGEETVDGPLDPKVTTIDSTFDPQ